MEIRHADLQIEVEDAEDGGVVLHCSSISASSRRARASSSVRASLGSGVRAGGAVRSWDVD